MRNKRFSIYQTRLLQLDYFLPFTLKRKSNNQKLFPLPSGSSHLIMNKKEFKEDIFKIVSIAFLGKGKR